MPFTGDEDHSITLEKAAQFTENYRNSAGAAAFLGAFFGKAALDHILSQDGCVGIRIYNAEKDNGDPNFVLVGVDASGNDLTEGEIAEWGSGCPPNCPPSSPLTGTA